MAACPRCGTPLGDPPPLACGNCGMIFAPKHDLGSVEPSVTPSPAPLTGVCPNCKIAMTRSGQLNFRVGGYTGGSGMMLGNWNQLAEKLQPFAVFHCPNCGRVDLYESTR